MMKPLYYFDNVTQEAKPLTLVIIGPKGSGKTTFFGMLKDIEPRLRGDSYWNVMNMTDHPNVCDGVPNWNCIRKMPAGTPSHILWVDSGDRVERKPDYHDKITLDPHAMVMVDNSQGLMDLKEEAQMCIEMLNLIPENADAEGDKTE